MCMPNFGPGGDSGLGQHGYGRTSEWSIIEQSDNMVELSLNGQGDYTFLDATLRYEVLDGIFEMSLTLKNFGDAPLKVAPGFHPYFAHANHPVEIDDEEYDDLGALEGTKFVEGNRRVLNIGGKRIRLHSEHLETWALWTDQLGPYICVEPTQSGNAFAEDISRADTLKWGESKTYECTLTW